MNKRIESYIAGLFRGVPMTRRAQELREELTANCLERYEDYLREAKPSASWRRTSATSTRCWTT